MSTWSRFKSLYYHHADLGLALDISRIPFPDDFLAAKDAAMQQAFADMAALEKGAIANPDENRMVGHYWLRAPQLAPTPALAAEISSTLAAIKDFAARVHSGAITGPNGGSHHAGTPVPLLRQHGL
jgi:glucose-6-phosphate isomerase